MSFNEKSLRQQYSGINRDDLEEELISIGEQLDSLREKMGLETKDYAYEDYSQLNKNRLIDQLIKLSRELFDLEEAERKKKAENEAKKAAEDAAEAEALAAKKAAEDAAEAEALAAKKAAFDKNAILEQYANIGREELVHKLHRLGKSLDKLRSILNQENKNYGKYKYADEFYWNEARLLEYLVALSYERFELLSTQPADFLANMLEEAEEHIENLTEKCTKLASDSETINNHIILQQQELDTHKQQLQQAETQAQSDAATIQELNQQLGTCTEQLQQAETQAQSDAARIQELQQQLATAKKNAAENPVSGLGSTKVDELAHEVEKLRRTVYDISEKKKKSDMANAELRNQLSQVNSELNSLRIALRKAKQPTGATPPTPPMAPTPTKAKKRRFNLKDII